MSEIDPAEQQLRGPEKARVGGSRVAAFLKDYGLGIGLCALGVAFAATIMEERIIDNSGVTLSIFLAVFGFATLLVVLGVICFLFSGEHGKDNQHFYD